MKLYAGGMKGIILAACLIAVLGLRTASADDANPKTQELKQKIADIALLHQQLGERIHQAQAARDALSEQQDTLAAEIKLLAKSLKLNSLPQALKNLRIHYNIELLRSLYAYTAFLDDKMQFYRIGRDKLSYLHQSASDDIEMINTLDDLKIDALTTQISLVVNQYLPEAHIIQVAPAAIAPPSPEQVWARITRVE